MISFVLWEGYSELDIYLFIDFTFSVIYLRTLLRFRIPNTSTFEAFQIFSILRID